MVELLYDALNFAEVYHHAVFVELLGFAVDFNDGIVAMGSVAFAFVGQVQLMGVGYFYALSDVVHFSVCYNINIVYLVFSVFRLQ